MYWEESKQIRPQDGIFRDKQGCELLAFERVLACGNITAINRVREAEENIFNHKKKEILHKFKSLGSWWRDINQVINSYFRTVVKGFLVYYLPVAGEQGSEW